MKWLLDKVEADFENKLIHSAVLKWIVVIGGTISLSIVGMITYNSWGAELCKPVFSGECLNNLSNNMQLPAKLITATLALSGFWALIFRSHQTTEQIVTSQKQTQLTIDNNTFNNFIAHKKAFIEMLVEIETQYECKVINKSYIYESLFPDNSPTYINFKSETKAFRHLEEQYENVLEKLSPVASEIVKIDPRIDEEEPLQTSYIQNFIFIHDHMLELQSGLKSLHIKAINFSDIKYDNLDESGHYTATVKVPTDLTKLIQVVSTMHGRLARFSNMQNCKSIYPSPEMINAINTYNLSARVISTN